MKPHPRRNISIREANKLYYKRCVGDYFDGSENEDKDNGVHMFICGGHKILIESHVDALESAVQTYSCSSKIEFQPVLGFEQFSLTDLCHFWWESKLSNTTQILCCRVDARNNCIRRLDTYTREVLCGPGCPYNPEFHFKHLKFILDILCSMQPGRYLLEHAAGNAFLFLFEEKEKGFTTIETKYKDLLSGKTELIMTNQVSTAWLPIDTNILPNHTTESVPWLFRIASHNLEMIPLGKRTNYNYKKPNNKSRKKSTSKNKKLHRPYANTLTPLTVDSTSYNSEPPPPGTEPDTRSPVFKNPITYDDIEFGDF
jgi:NMDA receptor-regulated gene protein 2.